MEHSPVLIDALIAQEFYSFTRCVFRELYPAEELQPAPYLEAMCFAMHSAIELEGSRLLVAIPPRHLKSTCASVALPAFLLGRNPSTMIMVASYNQEFGALHASQFQRVIESDWYRRIFPNVRIARGKNRSDDTWTTKQGFRKSVSLGGGVTGRGADIIIIDDLMKASDVHSETSRRAAERYYEESLVTRLNNKKQGRIIALQQRLHEDDFAGYLIEKGNFKLLSLSAIAVDDEELPLYLRRTFKRRQGDVLSPHREDLATLEKTRMEMGETAFLAQYQQDPAPAGHAHALFEDIPKIDNPPERELCAPVVQSWDPAYTSGPDSAYSVCATWGWYADKWHLLDILREKMEFPQLIAKVVAQKRRWSADTVVVEGAGSGTQLVQQLRRDGGHADVIATKLGVGNKEARLIEQSARLIGGGYVIPTALAWYKDLRREFQSFPNGKYADQVDSISQFVAWSQSARGLARTGLNSGRRQTVNRREVVRRR